MTESQDSPRSIEHVEAELIGRSRLRPDEVCMRLGISTDVLEVCLRWDVVQAPQSDAGEVFFDETAVERIRSGLRLHHDLGINWPGVAVILELLDRIVALERDLDPQVRGSDW
jgi:chaperone modulatory protein CbpM